MEGESQLPEQTVNKPKLETITPADIKPVIPEDNGSVIVFGINASDRANRKLPKDSPQFGELDEGQAEATKAQYKDFFDGIFKDLPPEERAKIDILVIAGNANLGMPGGINNPHKRSVETAEHILAGAKASMTEFSVNPNQLLNKTGKPIELTSGRLDMEAAEDPSNTAVRVGDYMATLDHALKLYHIGHPGRKVVAVLNTQYDSAAPVIKKFVSGQPLEDYVQIEKRGGIVFEVGADGKMSANIQGHEYPVSFPKSATPAEILEKEESYFGLPESEKMTSEEMLEKLRNEPLDPEYVRGVVRKFAEKHIQHKNGQIIFVGSGSGKSSTVREQTPDSEGKTDLVDADFLYRETGAHPLLPTKPGEPLRTFPWWYMNDEVIQEVEKRCGMVNEEMVRQGLWALTSSFDPEDSYVPSNMVAVIIPWEQHSRNMVTKFRGGHYDGGVRATYGGFRIARSHREWTKEAAEKYNIAVVDSIKGAVDLIRSKESSI